MSAGRLLERIEELERLVRSQAERIAELEAENRSLREQLEAAGRKAARQAAPFRRDDHKRVPAGQRKRPGRAPGHPGARRPVPEHVDAEVEVPLSECPNCGGSIGDITAHEQFIEEIPPVRPHVTRLLTYRAVCGCCGEVHSTHPLQTSRGRGAAKVALGPRALALAAFLNKACGLSMRRTCRVLGEFGLAFSPGGLAQALERMARRVQPWFERIVDEVRSAEAVYGDETSWYVGGPGWWLWTFTTPKATLYRVADNRSSRVVIDTLGEDAADFAGVLVSDCLASYDPPPYAKGKCIAHHLRAIAEALRREDTPDPKYLRQWKWTFQATIALWHARPVMAEADFAAERARIVRTVDRLLDQSVVQPGDVAVQNRLLKQRGHLLRCLENPAVEPTNNRAERALRPAVIARKISCGNRTDSGRHTWEILTSLAVTCHQQALHFIDQLAARLPLAAQPG